MPGGRPYIVKRLCDAYGSKYGRELEGCSVKLAAALPPHAKVEEFTGKVVFVSPQLQPVTGQVRIWAEVENRDLQLRPGAHGMLTIGLPEASASDRKIPVIAHGGGGGSISGVSFV